MSSILALVFDPNLILGAESKPLTVLALWALFGGIVLATALWAAVKYLLRQSLPKRRGEMVVDGLHGPVTITRDKYGVPLIEAESVRDVLFGQGFTQAQDRLWQMELNRRVGSGRLAEVFGKDALSADIFLRRLGLRQAAQADLEMLTESERELLDSFCDGVNAALERTRTLPFELRVLGFRPEPWHPIDTLTWVQVMSMDLCSNWEQELLRGRILDRLGPDGAELLHLFTESASQTVPPGAQGPEVLKGLWDLYEEAKSFLPNGGLPGGSNAWVVSGERSQSGRALLANDPHLVGRVPAIWYESHLKCPEMDVRGASFPGVPFVVIGANRRVAWGITNSYADCMDLYLEKLNGHDYLTARGDEPLRQRTELIEIKDGGTHSELVEETYHGPLLFRSEEYGLALRWKNFEPSHPIQTLFDFNKARDTQEFKRALIGWQAPSSNFVYADIEGNIGYIMAGHVPLRKKGTGLTPVPGWTGEFDWAGDIPFEELPQVDNPKCGYVVTANNPVVGPDYPHHITWDWMSSARAQRIEELILGDDKHDLDTFQTMQVDTHSSLGLRFADLCRDMVFLSDSAKAGRALLLSWNGEGHSESGEMALYQVTLLGLVTRVVTTVLGQELGNQFLGQSNNPVTVMAGHTGRYTAWIMQMLEQPDRYFLLQKLAPDLPGMETAVEEALGGAYETLCQAFGRDARLWEWGKLHRLQFKHPMAVNLLLNWFLNSPGGSAGGDTDTVFQTAFNPQKPYDAEAWCPSFRQVVELSEEQSYRSILPTGQSGHPASRNYMDQFHMWCAGEMRRGFAKVRHKLVLKPRSE